MSNARTTTLYRMRVRHLSLLANLLDRAGHDAIVTEPPGMPSLTIRRPGGTDLDIVATVGYGDVDWYRWVRHDHIAPCGEVHVAVEEILRVLRPSGARA